MRRTWFLRVSAVVAVVAVAFGLSRVLGGRARPAPAAQPVLVLGAPAAESPADLPPLTFFPAQGPASASPEASVSATARASRAPAAREVRPTAPPVPPAKAPVLLGTMASYSGPLAAQSRPAVRALVAWVADVNRRGGVAGHPVRLVVGDDRSDATTHLAVLARVLAQGVVALVGLSGDESSDRQLLDGRGVPVLGALPLQATELGGFPDFQPSGSSPDALAFGGLVEAKAAGGSRLAVFRCAEAGPACTRERDLITTGGYAKAAGLTVVAQASGASGAAAYRGQCRQLKLAKADTVYVAAGAASLSRLVTSCRAAGAQLRYVAGALSVAGARPVPPAGTIAVQMTQPWVLAAGASGRRRADVLRAARVPLDSASAQGWVAAALAERTIEIAVRRQGSRPGAVTGPELRAAASTLRSDTLGGLAPALTGAVHRPAPPARCWFLVRVAGAGWTAPRGAVARCGARP